MAFGIPILSHILENQARLLPPPIATGKDTSVRPGSTLDKPSRSRHPSHSGRKRMLGEEPSKEGVVDLNVVFHSVGADFELEGRRMDKEEMVEVGGGGEEGGSKEGCVDAEVEDKDDIDDTNEEEVEDKDDIEDTNEEEEEVEDRDEIEDTNEEEVEDRDEIEDTNEEEEEVEDKDEIEDTKRILMKRRRRRIVRKREIVKTQGQDTVMRGLYLEIWMSFLEPNE